MTRKTRRRPVDVTRWVAMPLGAILALSACSSTAPANSARTAGVVPTANPPTATPVPTTASTATPTPPPTAAPTATIIDGTWEVAITEPEIVAAGIAEGEDNPGNYGHFTLRLQGGTYRLNQSDGEHSGDTGTYVIKGTTVLFTTGAGEGPFAYPFSVSSTKLIFKPFLTASGSVDLTRSGPVTFRTKAWTRIGP
jgi:hypothetical protein